MRGVVRALLLIFVAAAAAAGCGDSTAPGDAAPRVYAASSLRTAFPEIDSAPAYNFAGSNTLQTQIERGAPADVFASASPAEAQALFRADRCTRPVTFATNVVVMLVPRGNPARIDSVDDLASGARKRLAIGAEGVPVGDYTREVLERAGRQQVLENVVSEEEDVKGVLGKVMLGEADAGFVYATDAKAAGDEVRTIELPVDVQVPIRYPATVVRETDDRDAAEEFVRLLTGERGRRALRSAGFGLP
jgi:molybdate transport system substrate-binding protein